MWKKSILSLLLVTAAAPLARAQFSDSGLIADSQARRYGLTRSWFNQVELDPARDRVRHINAHVSDTLTYTVYVVSTEEHGTYHFSEREVDRFGDPIGIELAKKRAENKQGWLQRRGVEATVKKEVVPEITIYMVTSRAVVHAIDGETGKTRWAHSIGNPDHPTMETAASDTHVAIVNGSNLFLVDQNDGKLVWKRKLRSAPGAGPAIGDELIHVPMVNGAVETFSIEDPKQPTSIFVSHGRALIQPTITPQSVAWPTDRGHLYVGHADKNGVRFRLVARDTIVAAATHQSPNRFFVASVDGYVYNVHEFSGDIIWRFSVGEPISQPPVPIGDAVYVTSDDGGMYKVDVESGQEMWWAPRVKRFIAASKTRVYAEDDYGSFQIIDIKTGGQIASFPGMHKLDVAFINVLTDRIYLGTERGLLQCLRETDQELPLVHTIPTEEERPEIIQQNPGQPMPPADPAGPADPFAPANGGGEDPFAAPADPAAPAAPAAPEVDPFADPF